MQICAGLGAVDDYPKLARSGADEVFLGYAPFAWLEKYGNFVPLNRREVVMHNIQADTMDEMRLLAGMRDAYGVPVTLAFNSIVYLPQQYAMIGDMLAELANLGFDSCILADPALMLHLRAQGYAGRIHLSGEAGCINGEAMRFWKQMGISRYIFPRKIAPEEMAQCVQAAPDAEFEAFALNERCHFSGAFCNSLHCDELDHICQVEYRPVGPDCSPGPQAEYPQDVPGASGCGLCSIPELKRAGVTHLKLVGRGNCADRMVQDIQTLRRAMEMAEEASPEKTASGQAFRKRIRDAFFPDGCSGQCYYL